MSIVLRQAKRDKTRPNGRCLYPSVTTINCLVLIVMSTLLACGIGRKSMTMNDHPHGAMLRTEMWMVVLMLFLGFLAMFFIVQNIMLARWSHLYWVDVNKAYMAGLMSSIMGQIETVLVIALMPALWKPMLAMFGLFTAGMVGFTVAIRKQIGVNQREFVKAMSQHHSAAVLMSDRLLNSKYELDPELRQLAQSIYTSQIAEIEQMTRWLQRHNNNNYKLVTH